MMICINCRAIGINCRSICINCRAIDMNCRAICINCRAIGINCRAIGINCRTICINCRAIGINCRTICINCRAIGINCRTICINCRAIGCISAMISRLHPHISPREQICNFCTLLWAYTFSQFACLFAQQRLFRLGGCPGWFESLLDAQVIMLILSCSGSVLDGACYNQIKY